MSVLTTNAIKPNDAGKPQPLRHIRSDDVKPKVFDFTAGQFKEAKPHPSMFAKGPIQTSQMREMAENKARLAASAAKKAAQLKLPATAPAKRKLRAKGKGKVVK